MQIDHVPAANVSRLSEGVPTDTLFPDDPAHDDDCIMGHGVATMRHIYCGKAEQVVREKWYAADQGPTGTL
jgi:hypothetical protein